MQKAKQEISDGIITLSILGATKQDIDELVTKIYEQVKELTKDWIKNVKGERRYERISKNINYSKP